MKLFTIDEEKQTAWAGGTTAELFIYPVDATYAERDFICRVSRAVVDQVGSSFTHLPGFTRFLIPTSVALSFVVEGARRNVARWETFSFDGETSIQSVDTGCDFNLMVKKGVPASMEAVCFQQRLIIRDDFKCPKLLFFYPVAVDMALRLPGIRHCLPAEKLTVGIADERFELTVDSSLEESTLLYGKVIL